MKYTFFKIFLFLYFILSFDKILAQNNLESNNFEIGLFGNFNFIFPDKLNYIKDGYGGGIKINILKLNKLNFSRNFALCLNDKRSKLAFIPYENVIFFEYQLNFNEQNNGFEINFNSKYPDYIWKINASENWEFHWLQLGFRPEYILINKNKFLNKKKLFFTFYPQILVGAGIIQFPKVELNATNKNNQVGKFLINSIIGSGAIIQGGLGFKFHITKKIGLFGESNYFFNSIYFETLNTIGITDNSRLTQNNTNIYVQGIKINFGVFVKI